MAAKVPSEFLRAQAEFVSRVGEDWALVTAGTEAAGWNTMTIGWGEAGMLWRRPTVTVFVHPWRYTHQFMLDNDYFTVQLFGNEHKRDLGILGSKSGRDGDKVALTSLTPKALEHGMTFEEATTTLVCKKIYTHAIVLEDMPQDIRAELGDFYATDAHTVFVGELVDVL
ncbi:MAG: flavin reductase [Coriobacteriales bacterium]|nr:flavin reductase [Coriobacteriales bacterium]